MLLAVFAVTQIYACYNYYFITGWDVEYIMQTSESIAYKEYENIPHPYFSTYPNNILLCVLFAWILRVEALFGMSGGFLQNQDFYIYYYRYFQYYLMRNEWIVPQEDVKDMEFVNQMLSYPEDGCMQFVGDILVVKL